MKSSPVPVPLPISRRWPLALLCAVQSCERFAFLAMLPLFVLYAQERHDIAAPQALLILALFQALAYLGGLPGGWLADRALGTRKATLLGAGLLACGYGLLALDRAELLWPALLTMVLGHSAFRPGLHVLLARVADADKPARERVFLWHYLAANLGYAAGALFGEWAHALAGFRLLFLGATAASTMCVMLLVAGLPWLRAQATRAVDGSAASSRSSTAANMHAVWLLSGVAVIFWLTAQQPGSSLTVFAAMNTMTSLNLLGRTMSIGPGHFASLHGLIVLAMLPAFLALHARKTERAPSAIGDADGLVDIAQRVFDDDAIVRCTQHKANAGLVAGAAQKVIHRGQIEVQLARVLWLELCALKLDDDIAVQADMIKEQVQTVFAPADPKWYLPAQVGEADA